MSDSPKPAGPGPQSEPPNHELIPNPNPVSLKAAPMPGRMVEELFARAEKAVATLQGEFTQILAKEATRGEKALQIAKAEPGKRAAQLARLRGIWHDLRGKGSTMGYPLVSTICDLGCDYLDAAPKDAQETVEIADKFAETLRVVVAKDLKSSTDATGKVLMATLRQVAEMAERKAKEAKA
ncbi:MAG: hypothetical protein FJX46_02875 [Alphaproteobacteria bacterium]|nr:hypothetical protein [Alphaproteobacteria bacterium]